MSSLLDKRPQIYGERKAARREQVRKIVWRWQTLHKEGTYVQLVLNLYQVQSFVNRKKGRNFVSQPSIYSDTNLQPLSLEEQFNSLFVSHTPNSKTSFSSPAKKSSTNKSLARDTKIVSPISVNFSKRSPSKEFVSNWEYRTLKSRVNNKMSRGMDKRSHGQPKGDPSHYNYRKSLLTSVGKLKIVTLTSYTC